MMHMRTSEASKRRVYRTYSSVSPPSDGGPPPRLRDYRFSVVASRVVEGKMAPSGRWTHALIVSAGGYFYSALPTC